MDAKQIELQVAANQKEAMQIQSQLLQIDSNQPQSRQLSNRLEMINRAQIYWGNEYFRLTGQHLSIQPIKVTLNSTTPVSTPSVPAGNASTTNNLIEWKAMRLRIRTSLIGNPNSVKVESYLNGLEMKAGNGVPRIPEMVVFGKVTRGSHGGSPEELYGTPMSNQSFSFDNSEAIVLSPSGSAISPSKGTLMVVYPSRHNSNSNTPPRIETNGTNIGTTLNALGGE